MHCQTESQGCFWKLTNNRYSSSGTFKYSNEIISEQSIKCQVCTLYEWFIAMCTMRGVASEASSKNWGIPSRIIVAFLMDEGQVFVGLVYVKKLRVKPSTEEIDIGHISSTPLYPVCQLPTVSPIMATECQEKLVVANRPSTVFNCTSSGSVCAQCCTIGLEQFFRELVLLKCTKQQAFKEHS